MAAEMIERVARLVNPEAWRTLNTGFDTPSQHLFRLNTIDKAKHIIAAMREPTEEMILADSIDAGAGGIDKEYTKEVYRAMIDKALEE